MNTINKNGSGLADLGSETTNLEQNDVRNPLAYLQRQKMSLKSEKYGFPDLGARALYFTLLPLRAWALSVAFRGQPGRPGGPMGPSALTGVLTGAQRGGPKGPKGPGPGTRPRAQGQGAYRDPKVLKGLRPGPGPRAWRA